MAYQSFLYHHSPHKTVFGSRSLNILLGVEMLRIDVVSCAIDTQTSQKPTTIKKPWASRHCCGFKFLVPRKHEYVNVNQHHFNCMPLIVLSYDHEALILDLGLHHKFTWQFCAAHISRLTMRANPASKRVLKGFLKVVNYSALSSVEWIFCYHTLQNMLNLTTHRNICFAYW